MTKRQVRAAVERWRRVLAPEWQVHVEMEPDTCDLTIAPGPGDLAEANAMIWRPTDYERAVLFIGDLFWQQDDRNQQISLVHELLHLTFRDYAFTAYDASPSSGAKADAFQKAMLTHAEERVIERLAIVLVDLHLSGGRVRFPTGSDCIPAPRRRT